MTSKKKPDLDRFIQRYIENGCKDAKGAAIYAYYSEKTADQQASRLLKNVKVIDAVEKYKKNQLGAHIWRKEEKLEMLQKIASNGIRDLVDKDGNLKMENPSASVAAIKEHNLMQGDNAPVTEDIKGQSLAISFEVRDSVGEVKVTNAKS
tara:strand:+ start:76 stop:525 length:450 start_codon:yes stop_codon:yes gene_type:complete